MGYGVTKGTARLLALGFALSLLAPALAGCGRSQVKSYRETPSTRSGQPGMSTGQKVAVLVGAAALYYMYNKHKNQQGTGAEGQYYLSKNGRVYYRDRQGRPVWVTPPPEGIRVPADEAQEYSEYQGYNGQPTGEGFGGYGEGSSSGSSPNEYGR